MVWGDHAQGVRKLSQSTPVWMLEAEEAVEEDPVLNVRVVVLVAWMSATRLTRWSNRIGMKMTHWRMCTGGASRRGIPLAQ